MGGRGRWIGLVATAVLLACTAAPPGKAENDRDSGRGLRQCTDIRGYLRDEAAAGRAVHERPDGGSPILGRIAPPNKDPAGIFDVAVGFDIRGSRDGWLLVEGAGDDTVLTEQPPRPMYSGRGWIRAGGVGVSVQASQAFARPSHSSAILLQSPQPNGLGDPAEVAACDGNWVLGRWKIRDESALRYEDAAVIARDPLTLEAWATGICNIQETSCDGLSGDRPEPARP